VYFHEEMSGGRWAGFGLVWVALAIFTVESIRHRRRVFRLTVEAASV
jgi:chloramphenicol-sensitive protein RarD